MCILIYLYMEPHEISKGPGLTDEDNEGQDETTTEPIKVVNKKLQVYFIITCNSIIFQLSAPGGKKGKKSKKTFADVDW